MNTWCSNRLAGFHFKSHVFSSVTLCVWSQGAGNVRGMTVPSAVPRRLPPATSAHAPFARSTRKGHSPPPRSKAASAAPVTTPLVRWGPTPALPSHTAPPPAPSEWKRSRRQRRTQWLPSDSSAQLNTSFPVKYATVGLQATSGLKQRAMKGNPVLYDQCCGPHTKRRHTDEHLSAVCGTSSVLTGKASRHHLRCFLWVVFFLFSAMKHHLKGPVQLNCARWVEPPHHCVIFFCRFSKLEKLSVLSHILIFRHFDEMRWGWESKDREKERQGQSSPPPPPPSRSTSCLPAVRRVSHTGGLFLPLCSQSSLPTWSVFPLLSFFLEKGTGRNDWICAIFVSPGTTLHSNAPTYVFNILMGIDEYNYIQYLCLLMFTDGFSHFISVSGVLCLFV